MTPSSAPDSTPTLGTSLTELRRELLQRAVEEAAKARTCRKRGQISRARRLEEHAQRMVAAARAIEINRDA